MGNTELDHHAMKKILQDWLRDKSADAPAAITYARQLTSLVTANSGLDEIEEFCWSLWQTFIDVAESAGSYNGEESLVTIDKLVSLVKAVRDSEPLRNENGEIVTLWAGKCWVDLPLLGPQLRENWNEIPQKPSQLEKHINKNLFAARLMHFDTYDTSLFGLWAIRAIEGEISWCDTPPLELAIPLAHVWIMNAGSKLVLLDDDRGTAGKGGHLCNGKPGYCKERWRFWQQRLENLSRDDQLSEQAQRLSDEAGGRIVSLLADDAIYS